MQTSVEKILRVAEDARLLITDPESWIQGGFYREDEWGKKIAFCAIGAIGEACQKEQGNTGYIGGPLYQALVKELQAVIRDTNKDEYWEHDGSIASWNDSHRTTHAKVKATFDELVHRLIERAGRVMACKCGKELDINEAEAVYDDQGILCR